jgi:formylmethanofuran dehydrogenase subunit A
LTQKGHLGVGADADVAIYPEKPDVGGFLFSYPRYVIKAGQVVVEEGDLKAVTEGREFIFQPEFDAQVEAFLQPLFQQYYTMSFENYPVEIERLRHPELITPSKRT